MSLRGVLVALIVAATAAFVTGVAIERNDRSAEPAHHGAAEHTEGDASEPPDAASEHDSAEELRPLGVDVEAWPFVALAAAASLALAAALLRLRAAAALVVVAVAMLAFAALDVRELVHQVGENRAGLAILATAVAALHLAAATVAVVMRA
jgi:hypothetical protein